MPRALVILPLIAIYLLAGTYGVAVYNGVGVPVYVEVKLAKGNGSVVITGLTAYDPLFEVSVKSACWEAAIAAGYNPYAYNYIVQITPLNGSRWLVGPSLSLAAALATYSAFTGTKVNQSLLITGAVFPGGVVGLVGGIVEKAKAVKDYGFKALMAPILQEYQFRLVDVPTLYGVYGILREIPIVTRLELPAPLIQVGSIYNAIEIATNVKPASRTASNELPLNATRLLLEEAKRYIDKALAVAKTPALRQYVAEAIAYLQTAYNATPVAVEAAANALQRAAFVYFYAKLLDDTRTAQREMNLYYLALLETAHRAFNNTYPALGNLCEAALAAMYLHESELIAVDVARSLDYFQATNAPQYAADAAYEYSTLITNLWLAVVYSAIPPTGPTVNISAAAENYARYVENAFMYARYYVVATGVTAPDLFGVPHYARALYALRRGDSLAALGYLMIYLGNLYTYFALHPGMPNATAPKYLAYLDLINRTVTDGYYIHANIYAALYQKAYESKIFRLARAQACATLKKLAALQETPALQGPHLSEKPRRARALYIPL